MRRTLKTEALVLKKKNLPSKDNIITLFSSEVGKIQVFAKGVKSVSSRRLPHLQTTNLINTVIHRANDRLYLQETSLISAFSQIKKNHEKMSFVYFFLHVLDRLLPEAQKESEIYLLTKKFLIDLSNSPEFSTHKLEMYLNVLLERLGYIDEKKSLAQLRNLIEELTNEKLTLFVL